MMRRFLVALTLLVAFVAPSLGRTADATDAQTVVDRMIARNPSLSSYRARVHIHFKMNNFPWYASNLDGTSYFKRPNNYEVVFDKVPWYAKSFPRLFDDVGDPTSWLRTENIALLPPTTRDGKTYLVLKLTKKIHSSILDYALAYIDPKSYTLDRMEWQYTSGGRIVMTQQYALEGGYSVIVAQHAEIDIPHVRAIADSSYDPYQTNVAVNDSVFRQR
ncbi:MAG: LolA family protein [Vulcanimicrobiaceae bacterium]